VRYQREIAEKLEIADKAIEEARSMALVDNRRMAFSLNRLRNAISGLNDWLSSDRP
jgi:hypothetical protein